MAHHKSTRTPKYRRQKRKGRADLAFVELDGQRHYLGEYDTTGSKEAYHRLVAEWTANARRMPVPKAEITITELIARFWHHVEGYYKKADGSPTKEVDQFRLALRPLNELYGSCVKQLVQLQKKLTDYTRAGANILAISAKALPRGPSYLRIGCTLAFPWRTTTG